MGCVHGSLKYLSSEIEKLRLVATAAALIDATLLLRHSRRPVSFPRTRVTWALERPAGIWKVVHVHYSIPVGVPLHAME